MGQLHVRMTLQTSCDELFNGGAEGARTVQIVAEVVAQCRADFGRQTGYGTTQKPQAADRRPQNTVDTLDHHDAGTWSGVMGARVAMGTAGRLGREVLGFG
jgi:hypothetical protein